MLQNVKKEEINKSINVMNSEKFVCLY